MTATYDLSPLDRKSVHFFRPNEDVCPGKHCAKEKCASYNIGRSA